jgi:hypothetical protein
MDIQDVLYKLAEGGRVVREIWSSTEAPASGYDLIYLEMLAPVSALNAAGYRESFVPQAVIMAVMRNGERAHWTPSQGDVLARDWGMYKAPEPGDAA